MQSVRPWVALYGVFLSRAKQNPVDYSTGRLFTPGIPRTISTPSRSRWTPAPGGAGSWGLTVLGVYADEAVSGTKLSRRNFDRMMEDLRAGLADTVVIYDQSRLMRDIRKSDNFMMESIQAVIQLISVFVIYALIVVWVWNERQSQKSVELAILFLTVFRERYNHVPM